MERAKATRAPPPTVSEEEGGERPALLLRASCSHLEVRREEGGELEGQGGAEGGGEGGGEVEVTFWRSRLPFFRSVLRPTISLVTGVWSKAQMSLGGMRLPSGSVRASNIRAANSSISACGSAITRRLTRRLARSVAIPAASPAAKWLH